MINGKQLLSSALLIISDYKSALLTTNCLKKRIDNRKSNISKLYLLYRTYFKFVTMEKQLLHIAVSMLSMNTDSDFPILFIEQLLTLKVNLCLFDEKYCDGVLHVGRDLINSSNKALTNTIFF